MKKGIKNEVIDKLKGKIEIETKRCECYASTKYYAVYFDINGKEMSAKVWSSFDDNCGETDFGYEINEDEGFEPLTDEEKEALEDYINDRKMFEKL